MNTDTRTIKQNQIAVWATLVVLALALLLPAGSVQAQTTDNESRFSVSEIRALLNDMASRLSALRGGTVVPTVGQICTMDAKICPDGSSVGRTGPNCSFAACPGGTPVDPPPIGYPPTDGGPGGVQNIPPGYYYNGGVTNAKPCVFTRNLTLGAVGEDVRCLQQILNADSDTGLRSTVGRAGSETTYFGPATADALKRFQEKFHSAILAPVGLSQGSGYFGASTRSQLQTLLNSGGVTNWKPVDSGDTVSGKPSGITVPITPGEQNIPGGYYYNGPPLIGDGNATPTGVPGASN